MSEASSSVLKHQIKAEAHEDLDRAFCIQAELPPQAELRNAGIGGFMPYKAPVSILYTSLDGPPDLQVKALFPSFECKQMNCECLVLDSASNDASRMDAAS